MVKRLGIRKLSTESVFTYLSLGFISMSGLAYINFLPSLVNALVGGLGFSEAEAGHIIASNGYGGILGSTIAIFLVRKIHWKIVLRPLFLTLITIDVCSTWIDVYPTMLSWRFLAGVIGGLIVGIGFSVVARLNKPNRAFGILLFLQFSLGSVVIYLLPNFEANFGGYAVFYIMASFSTLSYIFNEFLPSFPFKFGSVTTPTFTLSASTVVLLLCILCYQVAASGIWAYLSLIGQKANLHIRDVNTYIATLGLTGLLGALFPLILGEFFSRKYWISAGVILTIISALLLSLTQQNSSYATPLFATSIGILFFVWPAVLALLLAATSKLDSSGRLSTIASTTSSVGLATGPLLGATILEKGNYSALLYNSVFIFLICLILMIRPSQKRHKQVSMPKFSKVKN